MTLRTRSTAELVQIAAAGGGMRFETVGRATAELVQIAAAASRHGARITFVGVGRGRATAELVQIAAAGRGAVSFEDS